MSYHSLNEATQSALTTGSLEAAAPSYEVDPVIDEIKKNLAEYKTLIADIAVASKNDKVSLDKLMYMFLSAANAWSMGVGASETVGLSSGFMKDWHGLLDQVNDATGVVTLKKGTVLHPTDASGKELYSGGFTVDGVDTTGAGDSVHGYYMVNGQRQYDNLTIVVNGQFIPGIPAIDPASPLIHPPVIFVNPNGGDPNPAIDGDFKALNSNFSNQMIQADRNKTTQVQQKLLDYVNHLRLPGGIVDQLKDLGIDASSTLSVLSDLDDALASTDNLGATIGASTGAYQGINQDVVQDCQKLKNAITSTIGVTQASFNGMVTTDQTKFNQLSGSYKSEFDGIVSSLGMLLSTRRTITGNMRQ